MSRLTVQDASAKAVRFDRYGGRDVLYVAEIPMPVPGPDEVLVAVKAAGINPGEINIRTGALHSRFPTSFPSGEGSDVAGVVVDTGSNVDEFAVGDEVLGFSWTRSSHATHVAVPARQLIHKPAGISWEVAGSLYVVGVTAYAAVRAVDPQPGETVAVSAASGGVGTIVVQLLRERGTHVLGIASADSDTTLIALDAKPVHYGDGLVERLRDAAPDGIDAFIDLFGPEYVRVAVDLGISRDRIETIISFAAAAEFGTKSDGSATASNAEVLTYMADRVAAGTITVPIAASYPLNKVADAFEQLETRHTHGKIVLIP